MSQVPIADLEAEDFPDLARKALANEIQRGALDRASDLFSNMRQAAVDSLDEWEELRERGRQIKEETLAHLDHYLGQFVENAEAKGVQVHFARDREEACRILADLAEKLEAHTIAKSKSMTTEEIGLNHVLEKRGMAPIETDLGEWIIQLAGEKPSHIIAPAIHKTKEQISELFEEKLATEKTDDIQELAGIARKILRQNFADAELGVSGVNFAIAETGSFLVLENEGNARMSTSLPRAHIAVMGIEKILPRLEDLEVFLRLLPRSGTGQHLTSYQSLFTGPKQSEDEEGPGEIHVLILDNGRSSMLARPITRQSLACIRCGACLNACPVYRQVGGHAYGSVYPGPIGAIITPQLAGIEKAQTLPFASSLCGACRDVCPVKIDIPALLLHLRTRIVSGEGPAHTNVQTLKGRGFERLAFRGWAWVMSGPRRYRMAAALTRWFQPLVARPGVLQNIAKRLAPPLGAWTAARELRPADPRSFRARWRKGIPEDES